MDNINFKTLLFNLQPVVLVLILARTNNNQATN